MCSQWGAFYRLPFTLYLLPFRPEVSRIRPNVLWIHPTVLRILPNVSQFSPKVFFYLFIYCDYYYSYIFPGMGFGPGFSLCWRPFGPSPDPAQTARWRIFLSRNIVFSDLEGSKTLEISTKILADCVFLEKKARLGWFGRVFLEKKARISREKG